MFYESDLQSGITKALNESKLVACFVTDGGEESQTWEFEFLEDLSIKSLLLNNTVLLRLLAGSQEADYLAAIFPLPKIPVVVIIQNGQLKEYLAAPVSKEDFLRRIKLVFASSESTSEGETGNSDVISAALPSTENNANSTAEAGDSASRAVQELLAERSARLEVHKKDQDGKAKAKRIAEAKAQKAALEEEAPIGPQKSADIKYALMQKKRQQDAREERARILKRVEDDKEERKEREAQRKSQIKARASLQNSHPAAASSIFPTTSSQSKECALQIRLFDGSTIRSRFSSQASLSADVRPWIDKQQISDVPYTFKHVLTPLPNKNISISDETEQLQSQGLTPNATLILVPVHDYTSAYQPTTTAGFLSKGLIAGYGMISSGIGLVTGVIGGIVGAGAAQRSPATDSTHSQSASAIGTLRGQDLPESHQLYNGNALNFEPRKDDEDIKDE